MTDSDTGNSDTDVIVQKADGGIFGSPEANELFNISVPATWSEHADRHRPATPSLPREGVSGGKVTSAN